MTPVNSTKVVFVNMHLTCFVGLMTSLPSHKQYIFEKTGIAIKMRARHLFFHFNVFKQMRWNCHFQSSVANASIKITNTTTHLNVHNIHIIF